MKPLFKILLFVLCSFAFLSNGQSYHQFPDANAIWNTVGDNVFTSAQYEFRYGVYGDTLINSKLYTKVYSLVDTSLISPGSTYFGAIREDESKRVYLLKEPYDETILYDFSAQVGDTIWYQIGGALCGDGFAFWPQTTHYLTVTSIDSILLANNEYRKKWNMGGGIIPDQWVEGIGSIIWFGFLNPLVSDIALCGDSYSFACFRQNHETIYLDNPNCGSCYCDIILSYPDIFTDNENELVVFPNPTENQILVYFLNRGKPYNIQIFNMIGQNVYHMTNILEDCYKIPVSVLQSGQYILNISDGNQKTIREGRFIIK